MATECQCQTDVSLSLPRLRTHLILPAPRESENLEQMPRAIVLFNGSDAIEFQESELLSSIQLSLMRGVKLHEIAVEGVAKSSGDVTRVVLEKSQWRTCATLRKWSFDLYDNLQKRRAAVHALQPSLRAKISALCEDIKAATSARRYPDFTRPQELLSLSNQIFTPEEEECFLRFPTARGLALTDELRVVMTMMQAPHDETLDKLILSIRGTFAL